MFSPAWIPQFRGHTLSVPTYTYRSYRTWKSKQKEQLVEWPFLSGREEKQFHQWKQVFQKGEIMFFPLAILSPPYQRFLFCFALTRLYNSTDKSFCRLCYVQHYLWCAGNSEWEAKDCKWVWVKSFKCMYCHVGAAFRDSAYLYIPPLEVLDVRPLSIQVKPHSLSEVSSGIWIFNFYVGKNETGFNLVSTAVLSSSFWRNKK